MAALSKRLEALEAKAGPEDTIILVWHSSPEGMLRRTDGKGEVVETLTRAQFDALPGREILIMMHDEND